MAAYYGGKFHHWDGKPLSELVPPDLPEAIWWAADVCEATLWWEVETGAEMDERGNFVGLDTRTREEIHANIRKIVDGK